MKTVLLLLLLMLSLAASFVAGIWIAKSPKPNRPDTVEPAPAAVTVVVPTVERLQTLSSLVTQRIEVAEACETTLAGITGSIRAVLLARGDVLLPVDLTGANV
jgi:hypothetical protein